VKKKISKMGSNLTPQPQTPKAKALDSITTLIWLDGVCNWGGENSVFFIKS